MGLNKQIKKVGDVLGKGYQGGQIYSVEGIAPTLSAQAGNNSMGSLLVSTPTNSTSTPARSTEEGFGRIQSYSPRIGGILKE